LASAAAVALATALACGPAAAAQTPLPALTRCVDAEAAMLSAVDSSVAVAGTSFTFKLTEHVNATKTTPEIPAGTIGYGIVSFADHARGSGTPGRLVLEPRFLRLADGSHVEIVADPQEADNFVQGKTASVSGAFAFVPGLGLAVPAYNALHHGREVTIAKGTAFTILIGDGLATGACFVPPPDAPNVR
jgi:hypothetical protein